MRSCWSYFFSVLKTDKYLSFLSSDRTSTDTSVYTVLFQLGCLLYAYQIWYLTSKPGFLPVSSLSLFVKSSVLNTEPEHSFHFLSHQLKCQYFICVWHYVKWTTMFVGAMKLAQWTTRVTRGICVCVCWRVDGGRIRTKGPSLPIQSSPIAFSHLNTLYWQLPPCN